MASAISTAVTTTPSATVVRSPAKTPGTPSTPSAKTTKTTKTTKKEKPAKKERREKKEKREKREEKEQKEKRAKKRERETKRVSPSAKKATIESDSGSGSSDEDELEILSDDEVDVVDVDADAPSKNVEAEVAELLNGEDREKVIALAKEHDKATRQMRQKEKTELKEMSKADDKKLNALFVQRDALAKHADVILLRKLKSERDALERRIESQEQKSAVAELNQAERNVKAQRVHMRKTWGPLYKDKGFRYIVPTTIRQEKPAKKRVKEGTCCVCLEDQTNCAIDCGHQLCFTCAQQVNECPQCRKRIYNRIKLVNN
jgi:hypothetical protein